MPVTIEKVLWSGWPNCYRISNGEVDLIVTSDIGPRVMRYGFLGGQNLLKVYEDQAGKSGEPAWQLRGGHRLWVAPEDRVRTYVPDNVPVSVKAHDGGVTATTPIEPGTGLEKQMRITLAPAGTAVEVVHQLKNTLPFSIQMAPWALTMMAPGGTAITGFPPRARHEDQLAPTNPLVMWAFTDLRDKRWTFLEKYLLLRQDPAVSAPTKLGHFNRNTWGAYVLGPEMFLKRYLADSEGPYPDMGCSFETFTNADMLELETLGPVRLVEPGRVLTHVERWSLHREVPAPIESEQTLDNLLSALAPF